MNSSLTLKIVFIIICQNFLLTTFTCLLAFVTYQKLRQSFLPVPLNNHCYQIPSSLACENIRFSSLFAYGDVSHGGTSATQQQKFHTDDAKSVRNSVKSANWSTEQFHCFSYCLRMTDKRQKATKVKCKHEESLTKQSIFVEYSLL